MKRVTLITMALVAATSVFATEEQQQQHKYNNIPQRVVDCNQLREECGGCTTDDNCFRCLINKLEVLDATCQVIDRDYLFGL